MDENGVGGWRYEEWNDGCMRDGVRNMRDGGTGVWYRTVQGGYGLM